MQGSELGDTVEVEVPTNLIENLDIFNEHIINGGNIRTNLMLEEFERLSTAKDVVLVSEPRPGLYHIDDEEREFYFVSNSFKNLQGNVDHITSLDPHGMRLVYQLDGCPPIEVETRGFAHYDRAQCSPSEVAEMIEDPVVRSSLRRLHRAFSEEFTNSN
jgi:hypothetical protein